MNPLALLGASTKAGLSRKLPFAPNLSSGGYQTHYLPGLSAINPTDPQHFPDPLTNTVVAACVNAIAQALPDAPPVLEQRQNDGTWKRLSSHPLLDLLNFPNPYHSTSDIWALTVAQEATRGEAFWILSFDNTTPREIWVWPTEKVTVEGTAAQPISGYTVYGETGAPVRLQNHEVIHFRHRPAIANWRRGEAPLLTGTRQIAADNAAASYHSAILRNAGVLSLLISLKDSASAGEVTPGQLQEYLDKLKRKLTGDGAGAIAGLDLPLDVHKIGYSPDEMALDKLVNYYESRICALMGVDPMVCGLGSGTLQKTYANLSEALNDFWERQIIPLLRRHAATLTAQLFPSFGLSPTDYRLTFDTTQVPALQENLDALFTRWRELYNSGGCDLYTLQTQIGLPDVPPEYKGQFAKLPQKEDDGNHAEPAAKALWDSLKYDPNQQRDSNGRWSGGGFRAPDDGGANIGGAAPLTIPSPPFSASTDATTWLQKTFEDRAKTLARREVAAAIGFKSVSFLSVNSVLRGINSNDLMVSHLTDDGRLEPQIATVEQIRNEEIPALDNAIAHFSLPQSVIVERSVEAPYLHSLTGQSKGQIIYEPGYQSTTIWPAFNQAWHKRKIARGQYSEAAVVIEIHLSKGQHALPMQPLYKAHQGADDPQFELLLPRNGQMEILSVDENSKPKRIAVRWI